MDITARKSFWCILALMLTLVWSESSALIIYRFGGASEPLPPEVGSDGVSFIQRDWSELDAAQDGETFQLDMEDSGIRALRYDPQVNMAPGYLERGGSLGGGAWETPDQYKGIFDGDLNTAWMAPRYLCDELKKSWALQAQRVFSSRLYQNKPWWLISHRQDQNYIGTRRPECHRAQYLSRRRTW